MSTKNIEKKTTPDNFAQRYIARQRKETSEKLKKSLAGRPAIPESEKRERNKIAVYVSDEELAIISDFVGDRSRSDVIRTLVLEAAMAKMK